MGDNPSCKESRAVCWCDDVGGNLAESDAYNLEEQTIARFGRKRFDEGGILTNICADSRPPPAFGRILPEEIRRIIAAKCSAKLKGRKCGPYSEAHRAAISAGLRVRAYRHTEECKERARQRLLGTTHPPMPLESRLKLGQARIGSGNPMFGKNHTADAVALIAAAPTVRWNAFAERMKREIEACVREGAVSQKAVMRRLNDKGITTRYGKRWNAMSISYLLSTMGLSMKDFLAEGTSLSGPVPFKGYTAYEQTRRRKPNRCAHRLENNVAAQSKLEI